MLRNVTEHREGERVGKEDQRLTHASTTILVATRCRKR